MLIYRFRNCLLNTIERSVIKEDQYVDLTTKNFDVLLYLIENAGKIVTKDELLGAVWGGSVVEESNLPVHISKLRRSLGQARSERYIETIQGTGYRFIAPVVAVRTDVWVKRSRQAADSTESSTETSLDSIAVLPFENLNGSKETEYVADGLTEGLINKLSVISNLRVIARNTVFRYKGKDIDVSEAGGMLGVDTVLTGRARVLENTMTIGVELVRVRDGRQLWGSQFNQEFDEIIRIQEQITSSICKVICNRRRPPYAEVQYPGTQNPASYKAYLMGTYLFSKRTSVSVRKSIKCFAESAYYDSTNMLACVKSVEAYKFLYVIDAMSHQRALAKIQPFLDTLSRADQANDAIQSLYGALHLHIYWNFEVAERYLRQALLLNPNAVDSRIRLAEVLVCTDQSEEAKEQIAQALQLDPFSLSTYNRVARVLYHLRCYEEALSYLSEASELEPLDYETLALTGGVLTELCKYEAALEIFKKSIDIHDNADVQSMIGYVEALRGNRSAAESVIKKMKARPQMLIKNPLKFARIYMALGDKDVAYNLLNESLRIREIELYGLMFDPRWKQVRSEPRFVNLIDLVRRLSKKNGPPENYIG